MGHKMWVPLSKRELRFRYGENRVTRLFTVERRPAVLGETVGAEEQMTRPGRRFRRQGDHWNSFRSRKILQACGSIV